MIPDTSKLGFDRAFVVLAVVSVGSLTVLATAKSSPVAYTGIVGFTVSFGLFVWMLLRSDIRLYRSADELANVRKEQQNLNETVDEVYARAINTQLALFTYLGGERNSKQRHLEGHVLLGSKQFDEQRIVSHCMANSLIACGIRCGTRYIPNGDTNNNMASLQLGKIDGYVEYLRTGCEMFDVECRNRTATEVLEELRCVSRNRAGIEWMNPIGFCNNFVIVVREETAKEFNLQRVVDLAAVAGKLSIAATAEFAQRSDGLPRLGLEGIEFRDVTVLSFRDRYRQILSGDVQVMIAFGTDPELVRHKNEIVILDDGSGPQSTDFDTAQTCGMFGFYFAIPVFHTAALESVNGLREAIDQFSGSISAASMTEMITRASSGHVDVARSIGADWASRITNGRTKA